MQNIATQKYNWWKDASPEKIIQVKKKIGKKSKLYHATHKVYGPDHSAWKGGTWVCKREGYRYVYAPNHPFSKRNGSGGGGYYLEHRLVMEKKLGRILTQNEEVHHKNGVHDDNRSCNLEIVVKQQHFGKAKCPYCGKKFKVK